MSHLNITWYYFRFQDNRFDNHNLLDIIKTIEPVIKRHQPTIVYTNHPGDLNIDHRMTYEAVMTALRPQINRRLSSIFSVEVPASTDWGLSGNAFIPNWFVDIEEHTKEKQKLLELYSQELKKEPHPRSLQAIQHRALHWGRISGMRAAEAFVLHRHIEKNQ